jgi:formate dehydrogenase major subunit
MPTLLEMHPASSTSLCTGHFLQQHLPLCGRCAARGTEFGKEGTFTSTVRRIRRLYQVLEPHKGCWPDWKSPKEIANRFGAGWHYQHPSEIMDELLRLLPCSPALTTRGWRATNLCNGRSRLTAPMNRCSIRNALPSRWKSQPVHRLFDWPSDKPDAEFDLHLNNGRLLEHFHEGNLIYRTEGIREKTPDVFLEVSPELAEERGIQSGTWVQLVSRYG